MANLPLLDGVRDTADLRAMSLESLPELCCEIRQELIETVSKTAGHLASGLAVVELTVALHYAFDTPQDKIIWDVGHQAYPHKMLTGSRQKLGSIRQKGGLHAFIWRGETPYDVLCTGHASTSVGSALGLAIAARDQGLKSRIVAVIGDGSLSGGAAYEALNNAGSMKDVNLLVILNDNEMSISDNVGSVAQGLSRILTNPHYQKIMQDGRQVLRKLPAIHEFAHRAKVHFKGMVMPGTLFEELGFRYLGPVDGHDVKSLVGILRNLRDAPGLQFLHVVTRKGKGYPPAEADPVSYHGVPSFDPQVGLPISPKPHDLSFSAQFGRWLVATAARDGKLRGITPAMRVGSAMGELARDYPLQFYDVGIAEQHAMVFASGLAAGGLRPVVNIYSSFLQRAYDGVIHDMAIQNLPVLLAVDRGGIVGADGPTHQGVFDLAFLRTVPNLVIMTPADLGELYRMLDFGYALGRPCVVRYPRCNGGGETGAPSGGEGIVLGRGRVVLKGSEVAVAAFGAAADYLGDMCRRRGFTLLDMRFVKPLDADLIDEAARTHRVLITVEEGARCGGIGQEIAARCCARGLPCRVLTAAVPDEFIMEGRREQILGEIGLDAAGIEKLADGAL